MEAAKSQKETGGKEEVPTPTYNLTGNKKEILLPIYNLTESKEEFPPPICSHLSASYVLLGSAYQDTMSR